MRVTQGGVTLASAGNGNVRVTQAGTLAAYGMPTIGTRLTQYAAHLTAQPITPIRLTQTAAHVTVQPSPPLRLSQAATMLAVRGRVYNPKLRAWTYTLDGHDYYVLKLSDAKTLVLDLATQQWSWFSSPDVDYWRASVGFNWATCGKVAYEKGSNVIVGDDTYGILWVLDPEKGYDDDPRVVFEAAGSTPDAMPFQRKATGQMVSRGRATVPCYQVYLTASLGQPAIVGQGVTLQYSDDQGQSYVNAGTITANLNDFGQEFAWRSLGLIKAPGRLFSIEDDGALARIDGLDVSDGG